MKKVDKLLRIYLIPAFIFYICIMLAILSIKIYWGLSGELIESYRLAVEGTVTLLAAFAGILVPILINRNLDKESDRRILAFTLGLTWHESLYNLYLLQEIQGNFDLEEVFTYTGTGFVPALHALKSRVDSLSSFTDMLSSDSFISSQNSGAIKTYNDDALLNSVIEEYEAIKDVKFKMRVFQGNANKNSFLLSSIQSEPFDQESENKIKEHIKKDIDEVKAKLEIAISKMSSAMTLLDTALNKFGVKMETTDP